MKEREIEAVNWSNTCLEIVTYCCVYHASILFSDNSLFDVRRGMVIDNLFRHQAQRINLDECL